MGSGAKLLALAAALGLVACAHAGDRDGGAAQSQVAHIGQPAPNWSEPTVEGASLASSSLHGRPIYLNFFATWCHGCNEEARELESVSRQYRADGLEVVGVDVLENANKAASFRTAHHVSYPLVVDGGALRDEYNINGLPVQVFIDRSGIVRRIVPGQISLADMRSNVQLILR